MAESERLVSSIAERNIVSLLLRYPQSPVVEEILSSTDVEDFEIPEYRAIRFAAIGLENEPFDLNLIALRLQDNGDLDTTVTKELLIDLVENAPLPITAETYIENLKSYRTARIVSAQAASLQQNLLNSSGDPHKLSAAVEESIANISESLLEMDTHSWKMLGNTTIELLEKDHSGPSEYVSTGLPEVDDVLNGGLGLGTFTTIAARPGFGKSTLALDIFREATLKGVPSVFYSLEMGHEEVTARYLGGAAKMSHVGIRKGNYTENERKKLMEWAKKLEESPAFIYALDTLSPQDVRASLAKLNAYSKITFDQPIKLVVIDYLQLMTSPRRFPSRQEEVSSFTREIKNLAQRDKVAVLVAAQLNRGDSKRDVEHRPTVKDLRESGSIEQDSDAVILLAKSEEEDGMDNARGAMDLIFGKNRNGPTPEIPVTLLASYPTFQIRDVTEQTNNTEQW